MQITFLGTGEACDAYHPNSAILIKLERSLHLLDCGFSTPHLFFKSCQNYAALRTLWISHFHGDHFFGVPLLLLRMYQEGRRKTFTILSGVNAQEKISALTELAYPGLLKKLTFSLEYVDVTPGERIQHEGIWWQTAVSDHHPPAFGVRLDSGNKSLYYSGDGMPTSGSRELMKGTDLVIHEAFTLAEDLPGHCSIAQCLTLKRELQIEAMALIHLNREVRKDMRDVHTFLEKENETGVFLPDDGESLVL